MAPSIEFRFVKAFLLTAFAQAWTPPPHQSVAGRRAPLGKRALLAPRLLGRVPRLRAATLDVLGDGGVVKTVARPGEGSELADGSVVVVRYLGKVGPTLLMEDDEATITVGDGTMIPGWDAALRTMTVGEAASFSVAPKYAYGTTGVPPVVPATATLDFQVEVLEYKGNILTDATFADSAPLTPRTPAAIKAEFERRQLAKAADREGLEGLLDWVKSIYVFGFFDAPEGGQLPWYLRPIITFPVMFLIVGFAFWVAALSGAVTLERDPATIDNSYENMVALFDSAANSLKSQGFQA
mmetsp:Transcript_45752/g.103315  ORF Transcript_45752/g.103315 Transcript_45752/m.103315 type:complete len:296 (-) Transcript_45752:74-961(-)